MELKDFGFPDLHDSCLSLNGWEGGGRDGVGSPSVRSLGFLNDLDLREWH